MRTWLEETLAKHSGRTPEQVNNDIERDKILTAAEAMQYGLIDQVLAPARSSPQAISSVIRHGKGAWQPCGPRRLRFTPRVGRSDRRRLSTANGPTR